MTPTSAAWPSPPRPTTRRSSRSTSALSPTAASTSLACSTVTDLRATGTVSGSTASIRLTHQFTPTSIQTRWEVSRRSTNAAYSVDVLFPSTGRGTTKVVAVLRNGRRVTVGDTRLPLAGVRELEVSSRYSAYTVVPLTKPAGAAVHVMRTAPQSSAPDPGPTLAIQLERGARFTHTALTVRITPKNG